MTVPYNSDPLTYEPQTVKPKSRKGLWIGFGVTIAVVLLCCGVLTAVLGNMGTVDSDKNKAAGTPSAAPATTSAKPAVPVSPAVQTTKPAAPTKPAPKPSPTIEEGTWVVGEDFPAGTYRVRDALDGSGYPCYWEITKAGSNGSNIIANDLVEGGRPKVTLKKGQEFKSERCGTWVKVG